jgi:hypothetical protein
MESSGEDLWFFRYYRQRLANLEALRSLPAPSSTPGFPGSFLPEQFLLVTAGLESLATHWGALYQIAIPKSRFSKSAERLGRFLVEHGDVAIFSRCSMPDLFRRAAKEPTKDALIAALCQVPSAINPPASRRRWQDDPALDALAAQPAIVSAGIHSAWLRQSRYGEILYKEFRCNWVHELDGPGTRPTLFQAPENEPRYDNLEKAPTLVFPLEFLKITYAAVLSSFAARCFSDGKSIP